jgi:tetratricopeptide (TPR) repeat protein
MYEAVMTYNNPQALYNGVSKCRAIYHSQGPSPALELLQKIVGDTPEDARAYFQIGELWLELGRPQEAEQALKMSLRIDPEAMPAKVFLALLHIDQENYSAAGEVLDALLKHRPDHEFAISLRDYASFLETGKEESLEHLLQSPFVFDSHLGSRLLSEVEKRLLRNSEERMADLFSEFLVSHPGRWIYPLTRAGLQVNSLLKHPFNGHRRQQQFVLADGAEMLGIGAFKAAARQVAATFKQMPGDIVQALEGAEILMAGGMLSKAGGWLEKMPASFAGIENDPNYLMLLGACLAESGKYQEAQKRLAKLPDDPWSFYPDYYQGICAIGMNRRVESRRWFSRALEVCTIHLVHRRAGRIKGADNGKR